MPTCTFCLPCFSASATKNLTKYTSPVKPEPAHHGKETTGSRTDITRPTGFEYAGQATREFLNIVDNVAPIVPVPGFGAAVKIAINIIKACDESQAALESAKELKSRIQALVVMFGDELKGKKEDDIRAELIHDIDILNKDMKSISTNLDKIMSQHRLLLWFYRNRNESKVSECVTRLNHSIEKFTLKRDIDNTNMLTQLEQQNRESHTKNQEQFKLIQLGMDDVKPILNSGQQGDASSLSSRSPIPANLAIFHGRDSLVNDLVNVIIARFESRQHIFLSGPGGMGKTSTALAVMNHEKVKDCFADHLRVWVPCIKATSVSLFLDTLHTSLAISKRTGDIRGNILSELRASPPIIVLLDNFETPWNVPGEQSEVEHLLRDMNQIPHVTLFVTMRSSSPPCGDIHWRHVNLQAVDNTAAREIYTSWHSEGDADPDLSRLLELIGNMPLAVTLMAKIAKMTHLSAAGLVEEYNRLGTPMLGQGLDAENSMDVCIGLSVYSSRMKALPEAFDLLCIISMLPTGTSYQILSKWWASKLRNLTGALDVLKSTSLVEERNSTYFVLPVIQRYILDPSRFKGKVRTSMMEMACAFLKHHEPQIGKMRIATLSEEEGNLEAVLLQATTTDPPHIIRDGLLLLAHYQQYHRPYVHVIKYALKLARDIGDKTLQGDILLCYHGILHALYQCDEALKQAQEALDLFISVSDKKKAAMSRLAIDHSFSYCRIKPFQTRKKIIKKAQAYFKSVGDEGGVGLCYLALGVLFYQAGKFQTALTSLKEAESILQKVKNWPKHAECTQILALVYYWIGQYDLASSLVTSSLEEGKRIGNPARCLEMGRMLGLIMSVRGEYKESLEQFFYCITVCKNELGIMPHGLILEGLGLAWAKLGKTTDALKAFEESQQQYLSQHYNGSEHDVTCINFFLKSLENPQLKPTPVELSAMRRWYSDDHIDKILSPIYMH
ncbi:hypothetical protein C0995_001649 [Termitomyces sp. Mi166|nr:hypothetical protein C0995_001649 [Termitomyces sp. Mi166\